MERFYVIHNTPIFLGRAGEENAREAAFDLAPWRELYGQGSVQLMARRPGEVVMYPVPLVLEGDLAIWKITAADVAKVGQTGECELSYIPDEDTLVKSETWTTFVLPSMEGTVVDPPEAAQAWIDALRKAAAENEQIAGRAALSATEAAQSAGTAGSRAAAAAKSAEAAAKSADEAVSMAEASKNSAEAAETAKDAAELAKKGASNSQLAALNYMRSSSESANVAGSFSEQAANANEAAQEAAKRAEDAAARQPYPNEETGTWWVWDAEAGAYRDTGISCGGSGGGSVELDTTLKEAGKAADAKAVGDALSTLSEEIVDLENKALFETDASLTLKDGVLSVNTTNDAEKDNTLPMTSAGVYTQVGNIEVLLKTI